MIIPDVNLLVYTYSEASPFHATARRWWEGLLNGTELVGVAWVTAVAFVRLMTHMSIRELPATPAQALDYVEEWFRFPQVVLVSPGREHLGLFRRNLDAAGVGGNLVTDAHLAALAMEHQAELHSNDADFSRFPGLRWRNPL